MNQAGWKQTYYELFCYLAQFILGYLSCSAILNTNRMEANFVVLFMNCLQSSPLENYIPQNREQKLSWKKHNKQSFVFYSLSNTIRLGMLTCNGHVNLLTYCHLLIEIHRKYLSYFTEILQSKKDQNLLLLMCFISKQISYQYKKALISLIFAPLS